MRTRSLLISRGDLGFIFYPVITSHWCRYRRHQKKTAPLYFLSVYLLSFPLCFSLWLVCRSIYLAHLYALFHSTVPSFSSAASPLGSCVPLSFIFPHLLHAPLLPALSNPPRFTFFLPLLLSALPKNSEMAFPCEKSHRSANRLE